MDKQTKIIASILAKSKPQEITAAPSALWKFAWAANNATANPKDKDAFKETQADLAAALTEEYRPAAIKNADKKMAALGVQAKKLAKALVDGDTRTIIKVMAQTKLNFNQIGVLATIVAFYSAQ